MLGGLGFPLSGSRHRCARGTVWVLPVSGAGTTGTAPTPSSSVAPQRGCGRTRSGPGTPGLSCDADAHALAALLDVLAAEIAHLDSAVRWQALEACRAVLRETMANPRIRRTRRTRRR